MSKSPFSLEGKTAIVTGGGTGIGKSIAIELARAGADVALCSRQIEHLEPVVKSIQDLGKRSFATAVDVRQEEQQCRRLVPGEAREHLDQRLEYGRGNQPDRSFPGLQMGSEADDGAAADWRRDHKHLVDRRHLWLHHDVSLRGR
jgi:NAD(P)-dependent dehydrogenase (short-subunit alcohol dehydrogenase family)